MNEINEQLKAINVHLSIIDSKTQLINARLDELIAALHEYDDESYGESSFEAFKDEDAATNTNALNIVGVKYPISQKQYNLNRDKMANDHYELGGEGQNNINKLSNMKNGILAAIILIAFIGFIIGAYHYPIIMIVISYIIGVWAIFFVWWTIKFILDLISNK